MIWLNIKDRTFEATSPGDQVPSYDLPIFFKNVVTGARLVP